MKIRVYLKDPDGFWDGVDEAVSKSLAESGLPKDEQKELAELRKEKAWKAMAPWVEYGEYLWVEFDSDAGTASVLRRDQTV